MYFAEVHCTGQHKAAICGLLLTGTVFLLYIDIQSFILLFMKFTAAIKKNDDFLQTYKKGRYYRGKYLILYVYAPEGGNPDRVSLGIAAGKKVGNSVRRNRMKRLVRENYRALEECVGAGKTLVFVVRPQNGALPGYGEVRGDMKGLLSRSGIFDGHKWDSLR